MRNVLPRLARNGPEHQAIEAGEIDAIIDHANSNIILLPAARRALRERADRAREAAGEAAVANRVLAALPRADYQRLSGVLERVTLRTGEVLYEREAPIRHVYFPLDSVICMMATLEAHQALEVGLVGHEGMVGVSLVVGVETSPVRALVQAAGAALRMEAAHFQKAFQQCPPLQRELHRYTHTMLALARQTALCNRFHAVEARLARALLMTSDRVRSPQFFLTQEFLADVLGVRRARVNGAAGTLQLRKLVRYSRGRITILDRPGLEAAACRCYTGI